jgi:hypothetical protein
MGDIHKCQKNESICPTDNGRREKGRDLGNNVQWVTACEYRKVPNIQSLSVLSQAIDCKFGVRSSSDPVNPYMIVQQPESIYRDMS